MKYNDLIIGHRAFWQIERRAKHYDNYMKEIKNWKKWPESVCIDEVQKLLNFIPKWDMHFRGKNPEKFFKTYNQILPIIKELSHEKLENIELTPDVLQKIKIIFDNVAQYPNRYESTDCSKILHTILPNLIVMWDRKIRLGILGGENKKEGAIYAFDFLPKMQSELLDAISNCRDEENLDRSDAITFIRRECGNETLPKLIDEHNYVVYTRTDDFKSYLEQAKENDNISIDAFSRLIKRISN